jgi:hypothetical protein
MPLRDEMMSISMIGVINIACPITIPAGVKKRPNTPNGPALDSKTNAIRPIVTVGILNDV